MNYLKFVAGFLLILATVSWQGNTGNCKNSIYILNQVKEKYDASSNWKNSEIKIHIQEPRVGNPERYTKLFLNNTTDYFEMERTKDVGVIKRILNVNEKSEVFVDGKSDLTSEIKEKYALNVEKTKEHKNFYKTLYAVPMSITDKVWNTIDPAVKAE
ncbi:DUF6503 family protein [uncultured Croceitalea sp.]|uniref:DUF6503 family protein n=1 Tax=uncultured Croceitalea sp. TaxID=1798908 RepID=UPI0033066EA3